MTRRPKKYKCTEDGCDKAYSRPCLLEQHQRSHLDIRPFECDVCGKGFFRDSHLQSHRWIHAKQKPLGCDQCQKRFTTNQQLQRHSKTHKRVVIVEEEPPIEDVWKLQLDKMTKDIDSLVYDSPMDQVPSLDVSSFSMSPEYTYEPVKSEQLCPYDCLGVFRTTADLSLHMLESHILCEEFSTKPKMCWDRVEEDREFDKFVAEFLCHPQEYEESSYKPVEIAVEVPLEGVPELRYQRTFGSEGHRSTTRVEAVPVGVEEMEMGEIRRHLENKRRFIAV